MAIKSAIVPYQANKSSAMVQPQQSMSAIVPVQKETEKKAEVTARDVRASVLRLLRKRQQRDRLEAKYYKLEKTLNERQKARKEEAKNENNSFLGKVGSGFRNKAKKAGGDLLGSIGKLLGFLALDWISKPENQAILKGIVDVSRGIFQFIDWWVTGSVDNLLTGFSEMVGGDSLLERFVGFIKVVTGILGLRYFLNPTLLFKDFNTIRKAIQSKGFRKLNIFFKKWQKQGAGKALKFAFPKMASILSKIKSNLASKIAKGGLGNLMQRIATVLGDQLTKRGAKALFPVIKKIATPAINFIKKVPIVGPLIGAGINVALGDPWDKAIIKALGASLGQWLGAGLGTLVFPGIGTFVGGFLGNLIGDWLGGRIYDLITGKDAPKPTAEEEKRMKIVREAMDKKYDKMSESEKKAYLEKVAKQNNMTAEQVKAMLEKKATDPDVTSSDTSTTTGGGDTTTSSGTPSLDVQSNIAAILKAGKEMNYTGDMAALLGIAKGESGIKGIAEIPITSAQRASEIWDISREEAQQLLDSGGWRALYNEVYGWSGNQLGNRPGTNDGSDFIGRGFIQITGRHNYKKYGDKIGVDFMSNPELLMDKDIAAKVTIAYMQDRGSPKDIESALRAVGGIESGWPKKRRYYQEFKQMGPPYGGKGGGLPRQIPSRHNRLSDVSMDVVQSKRRRPRKKVTVIVNNQGDTLISSQKVSMLGTLNSTNKPQLVKRGI